MKKILITGFEPFHGEDLNPSRELALAFQKQYDTLILPVSYQRANQMLQDQLKVGRYDFILMLGLAGGRKWMDLERVAINLEDAEKADEDGDLRVQTKINPDGPDAFLNPLPLRDLSQTLQQKNAPVQISFSAGAFVCNSVYYRVFDWIKKSGRGSHALFVHLPYSNEQLSGKPEGTPSLSLEKMKMALDELLALMKS